MNYVREINAFYDWLETNSLSVSAVALWHALMHMCNKCGWTTEFAVATSVLAIKTGLSERSIYNARNELQQRGRIIWKSRKGNQSAVYTILPFESERLRACAADNASDKGLSACGAGNHADNRAGNRADNHAGNHADNRAALTKPNKNETETKTKQQEGQEDRARARVSWRAWYERKFAAFPSARWASEIDEKVQQGLSEELVIRALEQALEADAQHPMAWANNRLSVWFAKGIRTLDDLTAAEQREVHGIGGTWKRLVSPEVEALARKYADTS